jgi:hypothetical protein
MIRLSRLAACSALIALAAPVLPGALAQPASSPASSPATAQPVPATSPAPPIVIVGDVPDFGYQTPRTKAALTVTIANNGDEVLEIEEVKGDCSCTDAHAIGDDLSLDPGEAIDVHVEMEVPTTLGNHSKSLFIRCKGFETAAHVPLLIESGHPIRVNGGTQFAVVNAKSGAIGLDSVDGVPFTVKSVDGQAPRFLAGSADRAGLEFVIEYDLSGYSRTDLPHALVIETDHPSCRMFDVPVLIVGMSPLQDPQKWHAMDPIALFPSLPGDRPFSGMVTMTGAKPVVGTRITGKTSTEGATVQMGKVRPHERRLGLNVDYTVTPPPGFRGLFKTTVTLKMADHEASFEVYARLEDPAKFPMPTGPLLPPPSSGPTPR